MNVTSGGPHLLLFERDQQLVALLSSELALAGYEVHTARTAVEVFDAIARFSVRLVMVDLAQAQAGRREFWVALDAQRRGRGVQVFTFRCTNLAGYGPDDPDERVDTVMTDLEVDGMRGIAQLVDAVRARVPGANAPTPSAPTRSVAAPTAYGREMPVEREKLPPFEMPSSPSVAPATYAPVQRVAASDPRMASPQPLQGTWRPQPPQEAYPPVPAQPRSGLSTFTDKIRAVIYPGGRQPVSTQSPYTPDVQAQSPFQARPQVGQRFGEPEYSANTYRENMIYQAPTMPPMPPEQTFERVSEAQAERRNPALPAQAYSTYNGSEARSVQEESGLDQLSRLLHSNSSNAVVNGNMQENTVYADPDLDLDQQELQAIRAQILRAAQLDETYERSNGSQPRPVNPGAQSTQLRASPIQEMPLEREAEYRRASSGPLQHSSESYARPAMTVLQPTQSMPPVQPAQPQTYQASPVQNYQSQSTEVSPAQNYQPQFTQASPMPPYQAQQVQTPLAQPYQSQPVQVSPVQASPMRNFQPQPVQTPPAQRYQPPADSFVVGSSSQVYSASSIREQPPEAANNGQIRVVIPHPEPSQQRQTQITNPLNMDRDTMLPEQVQVGLQQQERRAELKTSDDMLLDIVKSLPPMAPAPPAPEPPPALNGRATRSLGSVLLEGHLVPEERLQVAQHVQRMMRGVDLNYQLGEILLMFKLLTPDQLLAASLVSYGMISTVQISALGRIRQDLHAIGLEYDLESLVILFRILTPEQMREVRASWAS